MTNTRSTETSSSIYVSPLIGRASHFDSQRRYLLDALVGGVSNPDGFRNPCHPRHSEICGVRAQNRNPNPENP